MLKADPKKVRIFVACTADLAEERNAVGAVVQSRSLQSVAEDRGVTLDLLDWRNVVPAAGLPENVILEKLKPATWDVFIGALWHRFGTPTGVRDRATGIEYSSGTEQEFRIAYKLWERYHRPRVSFYFSERKPRLNDIDGQQFELVKRFIAQFASKGSTPGLYQTFKTVRSFEELVRKNLTDFLLQRSARHKKTKAGQLKLPQLAKLGKHGTADMLGALTLRGIKETYYRTLDNNMGLCPAVRLNVMVPNDHKDRLVIRFVDDRTYYTPAELSKTWVRGEGKCGAAWEEKAQQVYASDTSTPERFLEPMDASTKTNLMELHSVVSTPIRQAGRIVGILNFDSKHDSTITKIQDTKIRALLSDLAGQIGPLLSNRHVAPLSEQ